MQASAAMSCEDHKNLNAPELQQQLVTIDISERLLQLQELQESSPLHDPLSGVSSHELATFDSAKTNCFEQADNIPTKTCRIVVECSIPHVMDWIGIMFVASLTALNSSVFLPVKNSRGGAPTRCSSLGHVDGLLPFVECQPLCCMRMSRIWALVSELNYRNRINLL